MMSYFLYHTKNVAVLLMLGQNVEKQLQLYVKKIRQQGGVVTASVVVAAARGLMMAHNRSQLADFGGHVALTRTWAYHFLHRMQFVKRKATTSKSKYRPPDFEEMKKAFLEEVSTTVTMEDIPSELIFNWDQTGIHLIPVSPWTMEQSGAARVEISGIDNKHQITAIFCGTLTGDFLPLQIIYKGKSQRCHPISV